MVTNRRSRTLRPGRLQTPPGWNSRVVDVERRAARRAARSSSRCAYRSVRVMVVLSEGPRRPPCVRGLRRQRRVVANRSARCGRRGCRRPWRGASRRPAPCESRSKPLAADDVGGVAAAAAVGEDRRDGLPGRGRAAAASSKTSAASAELGGEHRVVQELGLLAGAERTDVEDGVAERLEDRAALVDDVGVSRRPSPAALRRPPCGRRR